MDVVYFRTKFSVPILTYTVLVKRSFTYILTFELSTFSHFISTAYTPKKKMRSTYNELLSFTGEGELTIPLRDFHL